MLCYLSLEPSFLFFSADLPGLVYYAHIPATVIALLVGVFVFWNGRQLLLNRLLLVISIFFSLWTLLNLISWTNIHSDFILFVWSFFGLLSGLLSVFCIYFTYVFLEKKDISLQLKLVFLALLAPIFLLAPTSLNLSGFDLTVCDAFKFENVAFYSYYTLLGVLAMLWILVLLVRHYGRATPDFRKQIVLIGIGIESFLFFFFTIIFLGSYLTNIGILPNSELELYGFFGMVIFMAFIATLIVRFRTFNVGMLAAQALVIALVILIGSMFTFTDSLYNVILVGVTLVLTGAIGLVLIRSVKREVAQRELIQKQEQELEVVNKQQENLLHFISHEIKGYLTKSEAGFAGIVEGDYGTISEQLAGMAKGALADVRKGVRTVMEILDSANMKKGTVGYKMQTFDFRTAVKEIVAHLKRDADQKGLTMDIHISREGEYRLSGDEVKLRQHVIRNLVDNAIKYTPAGHIEVQLSNGDGKIHFSVKDNGVGITPEDMKNLFTEGGHGKDSIKVNVHSTGYGLFIAKQVVDMHGGKIWAESEGEGKGARFVVELPAV